MVQKHPYNNHHVLDKKMSSNYYSFFKHLMWFSLKGLFSAHGHLSTTYVHTWSLFIQVCETGAVFRVTALWIQVRAHCPLPSVHPLSYLCSLPLVGSSLIIQSFSPKFREKVIELVSGGQSEMACKDVVFHARHDSPVTLRFRNVPSRKGECKLSQSPIKHKDCQVDTLLRAS